MNELSFLPPSLVYGCAALFGLILGSFYTALASRILYFFYGPGRRDEHPWRAIFLRPSHCFTCGTAITAADLVPLAGYVLTRGRCRACGTRIGGLTLAGEIFPGILLPLLLWSGQKPAAALFTVLLCGHLYISIVTDWKLLLLDHENALFLVLWAVAATIVRTNHAWDLLQPHLWAAFGALVIFLVLFFASRMRGLGFGDVVLAGVLALYTGIPWALFVFELAAAGSIVYIFLIQRDRTAPAPLGTFLALGFFVTIVGEALYVGFGK